MVREYLTRRPGDAVVHPSAPPAGFDLRRPTSRGETGMLRSALVVRAAERRRDLKAFGVSGWVSG